MYDNNNSGTISSARGIYGWCSRVVLEQLELLPLLVEGLTTIDRTITTASGLNY